MNLRYIGGCHCGNIQLTFMSNLDPRQIKVRSCQCSFCRKHGSRTVSDPDGKLIVKVAEEERLQRYMFAHRTAEFLICRCCGVFVAAVTVGPDQQRAVAQLNAITEDQYFGHAVTVDFSDETRAERIQRRRDVWMPVQIEIS
ncbi:MAG: GFA family protein [Geminicoccaceae bacterium]